MAYCGDQAAEWSYDHTDSNEHVSPEGYPFSSDPDRYVPLCVSCHRTFDRNHRKA